MIPPKLHGVFNVVPHIKVKGGELTPVLKVFVFFSFSFFISDLSPFWTVYSGSGFPLPVGGSLLSAPTVRTKLHLTIHSGKWRHDKEAFGH